MSKGIREARHYIEHARNLWKAYTDTKQQMEEIRETMLYPGSVDTSKDYVQGGEIADTADQIAKLEWYETKLREIYKQQMEVEEVLQRIPNNRYCYLLHVIGIFNRPIAGTAESLGITYRVIRYQYNQALFALAKKL